MKKRRFLIVSLLLIAALTLGIGYAALSRELVINSSANLSVNQEDFAILFTDAQSGSNAATASVTANGLGGNYTVTGLSKQGDAVTITYTITNQTADVTAALTGVSQNPGTLNIGEGTAVVGNPSDFFQKDVTISKYDEETSTDVVYDANSATPFTLAPGKTATVKIVITMKQTITEKITLDGASVHLNFKDLKSLTAPEAT